MTRLVGAGGPVDMLNWDLTGLRESDIISESSTQFVIDDPIDNQVFTFSGKGFTYDGDGNLTGGRMTGMAVETAGELSFTFSAMKVDAFAFRMFVHNNDLTGLLNLCFGGDDTLKGSPLADGLRGMGGADSIDGGKGDDTILGGDGTDRLTGGKGSDTFAFLSLSDSAVGAPDLIVDLEARDHIDLHAIDANTAKSGDQAFKLVAAFSHHAGEAVLSYDEGADRTTLSLDVDGDGAADGAISMSGDQTGFTHFVL